MASNVLVFKVTPRDGSERRIFDSTAVRGTGLRERPGVEHA